ncbi:MAG: HEAT repeat domain-containing protein [Candidatus Binatia bacterium]
MRFRSAQRLSLAIAAGALLTFVPLALAQYGLGSPSTGANPGGDSLSDRYNKAKRGATIDEWVRRLREDDPETRLEAVKSLGESGDPKANDYLMQAVGDPDPRIQSKAIDYLGKIRATDATTFLIQRLFMTGTSDHFRHRILMALGKIGDSRASRPVLEFLERDIDGDIRGTAIYAIGEIGDVTIRQDLERLRDRETHPRLKRLASEALAKISARQPAKVEAAHAFPTALDAALQPER